VSFDVIQIRKTNASSTGRRRENQGKTAIATSLWRLISKWEGFAGAIAEFSLKQRPFGALT